MKSRSAAPDLRGAANVRALPVLSGASDLKAKLRSVLHDVLTPHLPVMSCCPPKTGLAARADDPGMILFAYLCALLPLAAIYALDFINKDWKSIRSTRRAGMMHLAFSLPPLAVVVIYIHMQRLAEDYKEMATAITAAILCILHVLRTLWGLIQLHAFKEWNTHALQVLTRMGFTPPVYRSTTEDRFSVLARRIIDLLRRLFVGPTQGMSQVAKIERIVDEYMMVNSSLVDNEFSGAELPCRPNFSLLWNAFPLRRLSVAAFLSSRKPEECAARWTVSFLSRFGPDWLVNTKRVAYMTNISAWDYDDDVRQKRLAAFIAFSITHRVRIKLEDGRKSWQEISILSPLHEMCSDPLEPWVSALKVSEKNALPYQMRGGRRRKELNFVDYTTNIRNILSAWHTDSLNELVGEEKDAVLNMNPHQVAYFSKIMEERDSNMLPIEKGLFRYLPLHGLKTFIWQLGYHSDPFELPADAFQDVANSFLQELPVLKESLGPVFHDTYVLQGSVHADNWLALEAGTCPITYEEAQCEVTTAEAEQFGLVFFAQKKVECVRLKLGLGTTEESRVFSLGNTKFLGCIMEEVRTNLAFWLRSPPYATGLEGSDETHVAENTSNNGSEGSNRVHVNWNPVIVHESCQVPCSHQLIEALQKASSGKSNRGASETDKIHQRSFQMRLLWEIQLALIRFNDKFPSSRALMMLCMLGYPSIRISKVDNCHQACSPSSQAMSSDQDIIIRVGAEDETENVQSAVVQSSRPKTSTGTFCDLEYSFFRIDVVEAPQPLHIVFQWNYESKNGNVLMSCNEGHIVTRFCWQSWKDGFMGRICAQSEWRSTRLHQTNEMVRKEAISSNVTEGISESFGAEWTLTYWKGWPPFLSAITGFERKLSDLDLKLPADLDEELDRVFGIQLEEVVDSNGIESHVSAAPEEIDCECGCKEHELFLEAKQLSANGLEEEASKLFQICIIDHRHSLALEHIVSDVMSKISKNSGLVFGLLDIMHDGMERTSEENTKISCRKFKQYDVEKLIKLFGNLYDKSRNELALQYQGDALFLLSQIDDAVHERCIEALESRLLLEDPTRRISGKGYLCLSLCHFRRFRSVGHHSDQKIGTHHFMRLSDCVASSFMDIGLLLEKGSLSRREYGSVDVLPRLFSGGLPKGLGLEKMMKDLFLLSSNIGHRISANAKAAFTIYSKIIPDDNPHFRFGASWRAMNRLALMCHRGVDGVSKDLAKAEALYNRSIHFGNKSPQDCRPKYKHVHAINAMCNLAVLYGQRKSVELFQQAIRKFEQTEQREGKRIRDYGPLDKHSSSMNNLAVIMESGELVPKNIENAKKLYLRSVEINENPIAMYNLAVLLKFEDPSTRNLQDAENLFSTVADLGVDLLSMPILHDQLQKARDLSAPEISGVFPVDVEEIDDCLAYVKIVDSSGSQTCADSKSC